MIKVLLVEDNPGDAELVRIRLRDEPGEPFELTTAGTLEEALLELARAPDVVILDLNLPDSDGLETLRLVRRGSDSIPIVVLTGTDDLDTGVAALREGADDYAAKGELGRVGMLRRALRYGIERRRTLNALRVAVRQREELLQVVSHDLRNNIGTIEMGVSLIRKESLPEHVGKRLGAVERASRASLRLLDDLVDLAALEKGVLVVNAAETNLAPLLADAEAAFSAAAERRGLHLELVPVADCPEVSADPLRVSQVLGNLLGNAVKLTPSGGTVRIGARVTASEVVVHVADTGPGIPSADQARVFERFFRGSKPSGKGAGLGLAIANALIEAQGGRIWVESVEGAGATFFFSLPRVRSRPADGDAEERGSLGTGGG